MKRSLPIPTTNHKIIHAEIETPKSYPKGLVIFLHGLTASINEPIIKQGAKYFTQKGYATLKFNFYAPEKNARKLETTSLKDHITDTNKVVDYAYAQGFKKIFLVGHSFGGLTILYTKLSKISGIVLRDASIGGKELLSDIIYDKKNKQYMIDRGVGEKYPISTLMYKDFNISSSHHLQKIKTIRKPIKIICAEHGLKQAAERYFTSAIADKELTTIPNASHCFAEKGTKEKLFNETYKWIKKR